MEKGRVFEGRDLEEAVQAAATTLKIPEGELHYEIVDQGRRGVFGFGAKSVRIRAMRPVDELSEHELLQGGRDGDSPYAEEHDGETADDAPPQESIEATAEDADSVRATVQRMLDLSGLELTAAVRSRQGGVKLSLEGPDEKVAEHNDRELLFALQFLLNRMARRSWPAVGRIQVTDEVEREYRDGDLIELVREVSRQVTRTGRPKRLRPMNAYERRLVHLTVREFGGLQSRSEGEGALKRVRIARGRSGRNRRGAAARDAEA